jgi:hypothetical protein
MTERRELKRRVRERMQRTGESYTTAHRQVATRRGPSTHRHHDSFLVQRLLAASGLSLSEPMVCGLGGGIGFLYAVFEYESVPHPLLTIVAQHHPEPWAPAVLNRLGFNRLGLSRLGLAWTEQHSTSTTSALTKLRRALESGRPALCTVDRGSLPWFRPPYEGALSLASDPYHVLVTGFDADTVQVLDGAVPGDAVPRTAERGPAEPGPAEPGPAEPGPAEPGLAEAGAAASGDGLYVTDAGTFGAAWSAHRKGRHAMLTLDGYLPESSLSSVDIRGAVAAAAGQTSAHLSGPVLGNAFDANMGLRGMARLAADLTDRRSRKGWAVRFGDGAAFDHGMSRLVECLQTTYTAADATRPLYADFLSEAAGLGLGSALEAAALFRRSGHEWRSVTDLARRAEPGRAEEVFASIAAHVQAAYRYESDAAQLLRAGP